MTYDYYLMHHHNVEGAYFIYLIREDTGGWLERWILEGWDDITNSIESLLNNRAYKVVPITSEECNVFKENLEWHRS